MICDEPTTNKEVSNKKYINDKFNDLNSYYLSKTSAENIYFKKQIIQQVLI